MGEAAGWAVVLGTSSGVGAACAQALAGAGLNVFGMHRGNHPDEAGEVQAAVEAAGQRCVFRLGDASSPEAAAEGAAALRELAGPGSVRMYVHSIANASIGRFVVGGGREPFHPRQYAKTFENMAHSFVYWARELYERELLAPGARILGLTNPIPENLAHNFGLISASKAALVIYVRHLAMELGPLSYRVNLLNFGLVETPAVRLAFTPKGWERAAARIAAVTPAGRIQTTEDVARFVTLLLDPRAEWLNGATIDLTGGQCQSLLDPIFNPKAGG